MLREDATGNRSHQASTHIVMHRLLAHNDLMRSDTSKRGPFSREIKRAGWWHWPSWHECNIKRLQGMRVTYLFATASQLVVLILGLMTGIIVARMLSPADRGALTLLLFLPGIMGSILHFGAPQAVTYFLAMPSPLTSYLKPSMLLSIAQALGGCLLFAAIAASIPGEHLPNLRWEMMISCLAAAGTLTAPYTSAILRGLKYFFAANMILIATPIIYLMLLCVLWMTDTYAPLTIALASMTGPLLLSLIAWHFVLKNRPVSAEINTRPIIDIIKKGFGFFWPMLAFTGYYSLDRPLLMHFASLEQIGFYSIALAVTTPLISLQEGIYLIAFVEVRSAANPQDARSTSISRLQIAQIVTVIGTVLCFTLIGPAIDYGFGFRYGPSKIIAYLMVPCIGLLGLNLLTDQLLRAGGHWKIGMVAWAAASITLCASASMLFAYASFTLFPLSVLLAQLTAAAILFGGFCRVFKTRLKDVNAFDLVVLARIYNNLAKR